MTPPPLPSSVCIRVTRACNAKCGFCLAPPDHIQIPTDELLRRLRWIASHSASSVTFCGGEPTVRGDLPQLLSATRTYGLATKVTTNGILISDELISCLAHTHTRVKISIHGPREIHNSFLGVECYNTVVENLDKLSGVGVEISIQTIVSSQFTDAIDFGIDFCLARRISKISFVPFIPRGRGLLNKDHYGLTDIERARLKARAIQLRHILRGQLDIRWLDFARRDYFVVETNGVLAIQRETESADSILTMA